MRRKLGRVDEDGHKRVVGLVPKLRGASSRAPQHGKKKSVPAVGMLPGGAPPATDERLTDSTSDRCPAWSAPIVGTNPRRARRPCFCTDSTSSRSRHARSAAKSGSTASWAPGCPERQRRMALACCALRWMMAAGNGARLARASELRSRHPFAAALWSAGQPCGRLLLQTRALLFQRGSFVACLLFCCAAWVFALVGHSRRLGRQAVALVGQFADGPPWLQAARLARRSSQPPTRASSGSPRARFATVPLRATGTQREVARAFPSSALRVSTRRRLRDRGQWVGAATCVCIPGGRGAGVRRPSAI